MFHREPPKISGKKTTATPHTPTAEADAVAVGPTSLTNKVEFSALMLANVKHGPDPAMPTAPTVVRDESDGPVLLTTTLEEFTATTKIDVEFSAELESALIPMPWTRDTPALTNPLRTYTVLRVTRTSISRSPVKEVGR
jgi:hypothetical protein